MQEPDFIYYVLLMPVLYGNHGVLYRQAGFIQISCFFCIYLQTCIFLTTN